MTWLFQDQKKRLKFLSVTVILTLTDKEDRYGIPIDSAEKTKFSYSEIEKLLQTPSRVKELLGILVETWNAV